MKNKYRTKLLAFLRDREETRYYYRVLDLGQCYVLCRRSLFVPLGPLSLERKLVETSNLAKIFILA